MAHLTPDEVTTLEQGTLPEDRLAHVAECDDCAAHLDVVASTLADLPVPVMPAEVVSHLAAVVGEESRRRTSGAADREERLAHAAHAKRLALGTFGDNSPAADLAMKTVDKSSHRSFTDAEKLTLDR